MARPVYHQYCTAMWRSYFQHPVADCHVDNARNRNYKACSLAYVRLTETERDKLSIIHSHKEPMQDILSTIMCETMMDSKEIYRLCDKANRLAAIERGLIDG